MEIMPILSLGQTNSLSIDLTLWEANQYGMGMIFSRKKVRGLKYPQTKEGSESPP